jgi:hypothetical protein
MTRASFRKRVPSATPLPVERINRWSHAAFGYLRSVILTQSRHPEFCDARAIDRQLLLNEPAETDANAT